MAQVVVGGADEISASRARETEAADSSSQNIPKRKGKPVNMLSAIKERRDREDDGFTLIELMVVVLIIAILLAIAIPTFLGARNSANARAAQSNLRNALTAEQTWYTNNQVFDSTTTDMSGVEGALNWTTGVPGVSTPNQVSVAIGTLTNGTTSAVVWLQAQGKDGKCYTIAQSNDPSSSFTAYNVVKATCTGATASGSQPTPTAGNAANNPGASNWYTSW